MNLHDYWALSPEAQEAIRQDHPTDEEMQERLDTLQTILAWTNDCLETETDEDLF